MATRKVTSKKANSSLQSVSSQNRNRSISLSEIESYERMEIKTAYIAELDGIVHYKNTVASGVVNIYSAETITDQITAMADYLSKALCDKDGNGLYSSGEDVLNKMSKEAVELIAMAIAQARQEERDQNEKKGKNVSSR
jgi:hypothetical protein